MQFHRALGAATGVVAQLSSVWDRKTELVYHILKAGIAVLFLSAVVACSGAPANNGQNGSMEAENPTVIPAQPTKMNTPTQIVPPSNGNITSQVEKGQEEESTDDRYVVSETPTVTATIATPTVEPSPTPELTPEPTADSTNAELPSLPNNWAEMNKKEKEAFLLKYALSLYEPENITEEDVKQAIANAEADFYRKGNFPKIHWNLESKDIELKKKLDQLFPEYVFYGVNGPREFWYKPSPDSGWKWEESTRDPRNNRIVVPPGVSYEIFSDGTSGLMAWSLEFIGLKEVNGSTFILGINKNNEKLYAIPLNMSGPPNPNVTQVRMNVFDITDGSFYNRIVLGDVSVLRTYLMMVAYASLQNPDKNFNPKTIFTKGSIVNIFPGQRADKPGALYISFVYAGEKNKIVNHFDTVRKAYYDFILDNR